MLELTCIICPRGCLLKIDEADLSVSGNACARGIPYGRQEARDPKRVLTSTVLIQGAALTRLPVKTAGEIPRDLQSTAMLELRRLVLHAPVHAGEVLIPDLLGSGVAVIATRSLEALAVTAES